MIDKLQLVVRSISDYCRSRVMTLSICDSDNTVSLVVERAGTIVGSFLLDRAGQLLAAGGDGRVVTSVRRLADGKSDGEIPMMS